MGFKILESDAQIRRMVMAALEHDLNTHVLAAARAAKPRIKDMVANVFRKSDTYFSLLNGDLSGEMGFYKGTSKDKVEAILFKIADLTSIKFYPIKLQRDTFNGGIQIGILKEDFSDLLNMTEAIIDVGRYTLPWLEWLLKRGDEYIFGEYAIIFKNAGRSGIAIMTKTEKMTPWRVDSEHSGTQTNNWLTRAVDAHFEFIKESLITILEEELN